MFEMRTRAGRNVLEALAARTASGRAEACKIVLIGLHVTAVGEIPGLEKHLKERIVPAHVQLFAVAHVFAGDGLVPRVELGIALAQIAHQTARRRALSHLVGLARLDSRQIGCAGCGGKQSEESDRHYAGT
jgi:hypothetical protein